MTPESLVRTIDDLASFPEAALRINELITDPATTLDKLAELILTDPALSARLLRLVNSSYYARPAPIETVSMAVQLIGFNALRDLVMATCAVELFQGLPPERINMERFWFHGVACGIAARELDEQFGHRGGEQLFLAGLLHGIGKLVFFSRCADDYRNVLERIDRDGLTPAAAEKAVFGFHYADLGGELLRAWHFPARIWQTVAYHVQPQDAQAYQHEATLIQAAAIIAGIIAENIQAENNHAASASLPANLNVDQELENIADHLGIDRDKIANLTLDISLRVVEVFDVLIPGASMIW